MSAAEITARKVYNQYKLGELPDDVKRQLMILFLTDTPNAIDKESDPLPAVSIDMLRTGAEQSFQEAIEGKGKPVEELFDEMASRYPWL